MQHFLTLTNTLGVKISFQHTNHVAIHVAKTICVHQNKVYPNSGILRLQGPDPNKENALVSS